MGGKSGGAAGPSQEEVMQMQRQLQQESFQQQEQAALRAEERAAARRESERVAELERRRLAEVEKAQKMAEEEQREGQIMAEAQGAQSDGNEPLANLNLDSPQIEQPDYAPRQELQ